MRHRQTCDNSFRNFSKSLCITCQGDSNARFPSLNMKFKKNRLSILEDWLFQSDAKQHGLTWVDHRGLWEILDAIIRQNQTRVSLFPPFQHMSPFLTSRGCPGRISPWNIHARRLRHVCIPSQPRLEEVSITSFQIYCILRLSTFHSREWRNHRCVTFVNLICVWPINIEHHELAGYDCLNLSWYLRNS